MGKFSRDKGYRTERGVVRRLQEAGLAAERVPLSGASGGSFAGDISCPILGEDWIFEVKCRANGFKFLYDSLGFHDALIVKADREPELIVLSLDRFLRLVARNNNV